MTANFEVVVVPTTASNRDPTQNCTDIHGLKGTGAGLAFWSCAEYICVLLIPQVKLESQRALRVLL